ncbi:ribosomal protein L7/L12, partial [Ruminococcus flavefaciens]
KGDVNCDGDITVADVVRLQKWLLAIPGTQIPYWKNADLCEDGRLDGFDLCLLRQQIIEQKDTYTIRLEKVGEDITSLTSTISIINKYLGCGLGEAKNIVNSAPVTITDSATKADADQLVADLEGAGATVSVTKN